MEFRYGLFFERPNWQKILPLSIFSLLSLTPYGRSHSLRTSYSHTTAIVSQQLSSDDITKQQAAKIIVKLTKPRIESGKRILEEDRDSPKRIKVTPVPAPVLVPAPVPIETSQISFKIPPEKITEIEKQLEENRKVQVAAIVTKTPPLSPPPKNPTILEMKRMSVDQIKQLEGKDLFRFARFSRLIRLKLMAAKENIFKMGCFGRLRIVFRPIDLTGISEENKGFFLEEFSRTIREWGFTTTLEGQVLDIYW